MKMIFVYLHVGLPYHYGPDYLDTHMYLPCPAGEVLNTIIRFNLDNDNMKIHHCVLDGEMKKIEDLMEMAFS